MAQGNSVIVVGNVTRDPELRFTASGLATASFGLAVNRRWQNKQTEEWEEAVSFFNVVCWRDMAENVVESCTKGTRIMVEGRLDQRSWETQEGDKRSTVEITADEIGISVKWATATVQKNDRREAGSSQSSGRGRPAASNAPSDEEPF